MRTHITEVETNIKVGAKVALGPRTLILGRNRSGKSTIVNAIEAAGSGRVSDVAGRSTLAKDSDLSMLSSEETIFASAKLSDGTTSGWRLVKGHRAQRTGAAIAFPLRDAREALLGEPDKARRWILQNGGGIDWDDVEALIPDTLHAKLRSIVWDSTEAEDTPARLAQAIDASKQRVREANAKAKAKPTAPSAPPPTEAEMQAAEALVASFTAKGDRDRLTEVREQINTITSEILILEREESESQKDLASVPTTAPVSEIARAALVVVEALAKARATQCAICGGKAEPATLITRAKYARDRLDGSLKADALRGKIEDVLARVQHELTVKKQEYAHLAEDEKRLVASLGVAGDIDPEIDPAQAHRQLSEMQTLRAAWKLARQGETESLQAEQDALAWGQLSSALSDALGKLVERARAAFEARVQAFLPKGWRFGVDLLDGDREVLRVGLRESRQLRAALSGAEWATVTAALALATAPGGDGPVVIAPEERAFDADTLSDVLQSFGSVDTAQVVITSPVAPSTVPEGWTVVQVGSERVKVAKPTAKKEPAPPPPPPPPSILGATPPTVRRGPGRPRKALTPPIVQEASADPPEDVQDLSDIFK